MFDGGRGRCPRKEVRMRKVVVVEWMTLDGVVQAPGHADEDREGGFEHGGWHLPYFDDMSRDWVVQGYAEAGGFLLGRRTYENLAAYWPNASEQEQVIARPLNTKPKYVATRTLAEPLDWQNSTVLTGDVAKAVLALKQEDDRDLHVIGSPEFAQTLIEQDLVDAFRLMIDPLIVGGGKRLFRDGYPRKPLRLLESRVTSTGAILATYATTPS
jgi:dihydrofolate reductase